MTFPILYRVYRFNRMMQLRCLERARRLPWQLEVDMRRSNDRLVSQANEVALHVRKIAFQFHFRG